MKKRNFLIALVATFGLIGSVNAQLDATLNLTGIYASNPQIGAEYAVSEQFGVGFDVGIPLGRYDITVTSGGNETETSWKRSGVMASLRAKYYFNPDQPTTGLYLAGYTRFRNFSFKDREINGSSDPIEDLKNNRVSLGLGLGAKYIIADKFIVDVMAGGGYAVVRDNDLLDILSDDLPFFDSLESIDLYVRLAVGYRIFD